MQINAVQGYNYNTDLSRSNKQSFGHLKLGKTLPMQTIADTLSYSVNPAKTSSFAKLFRELHSVEINLKNLLCYVDDFHKVFDDKYWDTLIVAFNKKYHSALFNHDEITDAFQKVREKFFEAIGEDEVMDYTLELEKKPNTEVFDVIYNGLRIKNPDKLDCVETMELGIRTSSLLMSPEKTEDFSEGHGYVRIPKDKKTILEFVQDTLLDDLAIATRTLLEPLHQQRIKEAEDKIAEAERQKASERTNQIAEWQKEFEA